jgi:hypothetical protein
LKAGQLQREKAEAEQHQARGKPATSNDQGEIGRVRGFGHHCNANQRRGVDHSVQSAGSHEFGRAVNDGERSPDRTGCNREKSTGRRHSKPCADHRRAALSCRAA